MLLSGAYRRDLSIHDLQAGTARPEVIPSTHPVGTVLDHRGLDTAADGHLSLEMTLTGVPPSCSIKIWMSPIAVVKP